MPRYAWGDAYETPGTNLTEVADYGSDAEAIAAIKEQLESDYPENGEPFEVEDESADGPHTISLVRDDYPLDSTMLDADDLIRTVAVLDQPGPDAED